MRKYRQLTEEDRLEVYAIKQAGNQQKQIAEILGVHPGTISWELMRNAGLRGYRPKQAHQKALRRRHTARKVVKMTPETLCQKTGIKATFFVTKSISTTSTTNKHHLLDFLC